MRAVRLQILSWEDGAPLVELQVSILACILCVAAFFCSRRLTVFFSVAAGWWCSRLQHGKSGVCNGIQCGENSSASILMLFPQLPPLPNLIFSLRHHLPMILNHKAACRCSIDENTQHLLLHFLPIEDSEMNYHVNADTGHKEIASPPNSNGSCGSLRDGVPAAAVFSAEEVATMTELKKKRTKRRLGWLLDRRKRRRHAATAVSPSAATTAVSCGSNSINQPSTTASTVFPHTPTPAPPLSEKVECCWEKLVRRKAAQLVDSSMSVACENAWDVHYLKVCAPEPLNDGERIECGGILLRVRSELGDPSELLQMALKSGLLRSRVSLQSREDNTTLDNQWPPLHELAAEPSSLKLLLCFVPTNRFRCVTSFIAIALHLVHGAAAGMIRCMSRCFSSFHSDAPAPRDQGVADADCRAPRAQLLLLPPHSKHLLQRLAERLNEWIGPTSEEFLKVCAVDVEAALLVGTAGRLLQHYHHQHSSDECCMDATGIRNGVQEVLLFRSLLSVCAWAEHRCRICHSFAPCEIPLDGVVATYSCAEMPNHGTAAIEWTSDEAVLDRVLSCVEQRARVAAVGPSSHSALNTASSSSTVQGEALYSLCGQPVQALYRIAAAPILTQCEQTHVTLTVTECIDAICATFRLVLTNVEPTAKIPCIDTVSEQFVEELSVMARVVLGMQPSEVLESVRSL